MTNQIQTQTAKHTPGPWSITLAAKNEKGAFQHQIGTSDKTVAYTWTGNQQEHADQRANAQLIAAAPDLLEELKEAHYLMSLLVPHWAATASTEKFERLNDRIMSALDRRNAAIAKAEGR